MQTGTILSNRRLQGDYFEVVFAAPEIAPRAGAGQFVHVRIDHHGDHILRRPFSIHDCDAAAGTLTVVYKVVGHGTAELSRLVPGAVCDLMGPLGHGYTPVPAGVIPVLIDGGYGCAATYMLTRQCPERGVLMLGARSVQDVILTDRYAAAGYEVMLATDDGSAGFHGRVPDLLPQCLQKFAGKKLFFYACGPHPMLMALARQMRELGLDGELSVDHRMCCGVGACFACVVKVNDPGSATGWRYARSCAEGPVFPLEQVYTE